MRAGIRLTPYPYRLHRAQRKRLRIVVLPDLSVTIYAPITAPEKTLLDAIARKAPWIARSLDHLTDFHPLPTPSNYVSGETFMYLGRQYRFHVEQGPPIPATGRLVPQGHRPNKSSTHKTRRASNSGMRQGQKTSSPATSRCMEIGKRHGIPATSLKYATCAQDGAVAPCRTDHAQPPAHKHGSPLTTSSCTNSATGAPQPPAAFYRLLSLRPTGKNANAASIRLPCRPARTEGGRAGSPRSNTCFSCWLPSEAIGQEGEV